MAANPQPQSVVPWPNPGSFRIVERAETPDGRWRVKYLFPDGSSARRYMEAHRYNDENLELVGRFLADNPDQRAFR